MSTTETQPIFDGDEILRLMQNEIIQRVGMILRGGPAAGLRLQVPNTNIFIIAGPASWNAKQAQELAPIAAVPQAWLDFARAIADLPKGAEPNLEGMRATALQLLEGANG